MTKITNRLYYNDSYTTEFSARIVEQMHVGDRPAVILDRTYFYPTGGGQPHDTGYINDVRVVEVLPREADGAVLHILSNEMAADREVSCRIDWERRFDHMQHHTGQHILTQAFVEVARAHTVGFHLSPDSVTIDLDRADIAPEVVAQAEDLANRIVYENRPVKVRLVRPGEAASIRVRMMPDHLLTQGLRVIEVEGFDVTACGGTHVAHTGEIGLIKVLKLANHRGGSRVEFRCGWRALRDYRDKNRLLNQLSADLTVGYWEMGDALARLRGELQDAQRALKAATKQLLEYEAESLLAGAPVRSGVRMVKAAFEGRGADEVRALASRLTQGEATLVMLGTSGEKAQIILARSADLPLDLNQPLQAALSALGGGRGGGRPEFCQGGGVPAGAAQVEMALGEAERAILAGNVLP